MKVQLFIHIGQPKTGSSAIQAFFNYNRVNLIKNHHVLYPNFFDGDFGKGFQHNHERIFMEAKLHDDYPSCIIAFKKCKKYCERRKITKVVVSNESFGWTWWPELLYQIIQANDFDFKIVLYLRRQDHWIESAWKQWGHKDKQYHTIQDFSANFQMDWLLVLKQWVALFNPGDFIIRPFEKSSIGDDVVQDFLKIVGIQDKTGFIAPPDNNLTVNAGLSPEVVEILRHCNGMINHPDDNSLLNYMNTSLSDRFKKRDPFKNYGFLTTAERKAIIEKYEESNREIAKMFFGPERDNLFLDPVEEIDDTQIFHGLTIENIIPVLMELLFNQSKEINLLKNEMNLIKNKNVLLCNRLLNITKPIHGLFHFLKLKFQHLF